MIDLKKYNLDEDTLRFLEEIRLALSEDYQNEVELLYKGKYFSLEPINGKVAVFGFDKKLEFDTIDELFLSFMIDGKPFIEQIADIEYE